MSQQIGSLRDLALAAVKWYYFPLYLGIICISIHFVNLRKANPILRNPESWDIADFNKLFFDVGLHWCGGQHGHVGGFSDSFVCKGRTLWVVKELGKRSNLPEYEKYISELLVTDPSKFNYMRSDRLLFEIVREIGERPNSTFGSSFQELFCRVSTRAVYFNGYSEYREQILLFLIWSIERIKDPTFMTVLGTFQRTSSLSKPMASRVIHSMDVLKGNVKCNGIECGYYR